MRRIMLFISSYVPLYVLLIGKNILERCTEEGRLLSLHQKLEKAVFFDEVNDYVIFLLLILTLVSTIFLKRLLKGAKSEHQYKVIEIEDQTGNMYFNYISIYLLSCMGLTLNSIVDTFVLLFLMILVGYIYITNHMTYMNPMLQIVGYKIYEGSVQSQSTQDTFNSVIIAPQTIKLRKDIIFNGSGKEDFIFVSKINASENE